MRTFAGLANEWVTPVFRLTAEALKFGEGVHSAVRGGIAVMGLIVCVAAFNLGTPCWWQSAHLTQWTLCELFAFAKVVSIFSTSSPQWDICG